MQPNNDGIALNAVSHPIQITDEMVAAGVAAAAKEWTPTSNWTNAVKAIYEAMTLASPPDHEISEDALETVEIEIDEWRPIETAPKDGTTVLLACDGSNSTGPRHLNKLSDLSPMDSEAFICMGAWDDSENWFTDGHDCWECLTHWMPLPSPPKE